MISTLLLKTVLIILPSFFAGDPPVTKHHSNTINKQLLLTLINEVRQNGCRCGEAYYNPAPALAWNDLLEKAAVNHATDMARKRYFSHVSPDGTRAGSRLQQVGYKWKAFGENIAMGYRNEVEVVEGWLKSPGHCKNIMNKDFKEMGVARAGAYWTQAFGAR